MFAFAGAVLQPTLPSRYHPLWQAAGCISWSRFDEICDIIYWRLLAVVASEWERWAIWKSNCKNRFLENFVDNITILLNYYVRYFPSASGNPATCGLLFVNSVCWRTHRGFSLTFLHIQIKSTTNVVSSCSSLLHQLRPLFCTAAMQVFSPVSLVFALHMIKIWNRKNQNRTVNRGFFIKTDRNRPQIHKRKPSQH